jgi:hypothetical protein
MNPRLATGLAVVLILVIFGGRFIRVIPPGHEGVAVLFGQVQDTPYPEGFHLVNPLLSWETFDVRQKTHKEEALVPTRDQLQTKIDVSVQYRLVGSMTPEILRNTGVLSQMRDVHLIPTLPYVVFSLTAFFSRYDLGYEQQATMLGAGRVRVLFRIAMPLARPGLVVAGLFAFLVSWSQYLLTLMIGGGRVFTLPMLLFSSASGGDTATIAVLSLLFVAPPILLILVAVRYLGVGGEAGEPTVPL